MALQNDSILESLAQNLKCPICFDIFLDPVTSACGRHNYCKKCLTNYFNIKTKKNCPECMEPLRSDYTPQKNVTLCKIVEVLGRETWEAISSKSDQVQKELQDIKHEYKSIAGGVSSLDCNRKQEVTNGETSTMTRLSQDTEHPSVPCGNAFREHTECPEEDPSKTVIGELAEYDEAQAHARRVESMVWPEEYFEWITFSPQLGHSSLDLSEDHRRVEVRRSGRSSQHRNRFTVCQVMAEQEFACGVHYWDVDTGSGSGWAIGVAYSSLSRDHCLGRTAASWCLEWSSQKLSFWHNNVEEPVKHGRPGKVRVSLDMDAGYLSFYSMCDATVPLHMTEMRFTAPVRPTFWLYGRQSGNSLSFTEP